MRRFWAMTPEDALFFANAGNPTAFNSAFFFRWGDRDNNVIKDWRELITGEYHILSIPEAHKLIGYYTVADSAKDALKVCRSYQYAAIRAIVGRTAKQKWGDHNQLGGFIWCTTGGGKTMTSFKAGQLITDMNLADKVIFVVDRKVLDEQSTNEYNSFQRQGESVCETVSSKDLFNKLGSSKLSDRLIVTSIQKISRINDDVAKLREAELDVIKAKRIVFIIDEAHRSQFGVMHERVKRTFYNSLFFGFTGTPIFAENIDHFQAGTGQTGVGADDIGAVLGVPDGLRRCCLADKHLVSARLHAALWDAIAGGGVALRVEIYDKHLFAQCRYAGRKVDGGGGFAHSALLVCDRYNFCHALFFLPGKDLFHMEHAVVPAGFPVRQAPWFLV